MHVIRSRSIRAAQEIVDWIGRKTPFRVEPDGWEIVDGWQRLTQQISKATTNSELSPMGRGANATTTAKAKLLPKAESDDESIQSLEGPAPGSQPNSQPAQITGASNSQPAPGSCKNIAQAK